MLRLAVVATLFAAALSGCSGAPAADLPDGDGTTPDCLTDCPPATLDSSSSVAAPAWAVGQWWEWETTFADGTRPETFRSVVVTVGSSPVLGTEMDGMAKEDAAYDHPLLGAMPAAGGFSGWGASLRLLSFPLTDGKAWSVTLPNVAWDVLPAEVEVAMSATFDADLQGFTFMGHAGSAMVLEGTYLPATGWFGELTFFDIDPGQDPLEVTWRAVEAGLNHTGTVYTGTAETLLELVDGSGFDDVPTEGGEPFVEAGPYGSFTMEDGTFLFGVLVAEAVIGTRVITLTDPANEQRQVVATGTPEGEQVLWLDEAGVAGQWHVATSGAGGLSFAAVELYEVTLTPTVL